MLRDKYQDWLSEVGRAYPEYLTDGGLDALLAGVSPDDTRCARWIHRVGESYPDHPTTAETVKQNYTRHWHKLRFSFFAPSRLRVLDLTRRRKGERDAKGIISVVTSFMLLSSNRPSKKLGFVAVRSICLADRPQDSRGCEEI